MMIGSQVFTLSICPDCGFEHFHSAYISDICCKGYGWTDGATEFDQYIISNGQTGMLPICKNCYRIFEDEDIVELEDRRGRLSSLDSMTFLDCISVAKRYEENPDQHFEYRKYAWWLSNNPERHYNDPEDNTGLNLDEIKISESIRIANLEKLRDLIDDTNNVTGIYRQLMKVEIYRHLGEFRKALRILGEIQLAIQHRVIYNANPLLVQAEAIHQKDRTIKWISNE